MKTVMIIAGAYGCRVKGKAHPVCITQGHTCKVSDEEAERLIKLGVAVETAAEPVATAPVESKPETNENVAPEEETASDAQESPVPPLEDMTVAQLKELAAQMGVDITGLRKKADILAVISEYAEEPEADDDFPDLSPEVPTL